MRLRKEKPSRTHIWYDPVFNHILLGKWVPERKLSNFFRIEYSYVVETIDRDGVTFEFPLKGPEVFNEEFIFIGLFDNA